MSGSGGGDSFDYSGPQSVDCTAISIRTSISSPNPAVLAAISVGDFLDIQFTPPSGPLTAVTDSGDVVGTVYTSKLTDLVSCIKAGHTYHAEVTKLSGADCQILITHV